MFWGLLRKKSLEEILFKMLLCKKYFREIAILNRFLGRLDPQILHEDFLQDLPMVCFVVTQHSESRVSHSVFATPKHLAFRLPKKIHGSHGGHGERFS